MRLKLYLKAKPVLAITGGRIRIFYLHNYAAPHFCNATIALMRIAVLCAIIEQQFCAPRGDAPPAPSEFPMLLLLEGFRLVSKITVNLNFKCETRSLLRKVDKVNVLMDSQANCARYPKLDCFF